MGSIGPRKLGKETPVTFRSEGQQVVGILHRPSGRGPFPAVVFFHGFTGHKSEAHRLFVEAARELAAAGILSLRFDFRGSGDSAGAFSDMSVSSEVADAGAALEFLRRQSGVDKRRIGILGMSMGGMIAALLLGKERGVKTAVLWNPVGNPKRLRDARYTPALRKQLQTVGVVDWGGWPVGARFIVELGKAQPLRSIIRARCPLLVIQAERDETVPLSEGQSYARALHRARRHVALHIVMGADHTYSSLPWTADVTSHTVAWFRGHLGQH